MLAESDSESAPSPTKNPRSRISSCKTYEEIRLEEIQAESAAFYFYEPSTDYQNSVGGGKEKKVTSARSQRIALGASIYGREKTERRGEREPDELDFQVLSLEEIRRRKKFANKSAASPLTCLVDSEPRKSQDDGFLKNAIKVLDELRAANSDLEVERASDKRKKRSFADAKGDESAKRARSRTEGVRVPPVRLKRSRNISPHKDEDQLTDSQEESDRLEDEELEASCSSRRQGVEVRLCDSSTDDSPSTETTEERNTTNAAAESVKDNEEGKSSGDEGNGGDVLSLEKEALHSLDTASDDILKDIDALLTDEPNS